MKIKIFFFIVLAALVTFSFTVITHNNSNVKQTTTNQVTSNEPAGGFASEDKF